MQNCAEKLCFEFDNSAERLVGSLEYMLEHIAGNIPARADAEDILFKSKVIITELLTNGIKHAGNNNTSFEIETYPDCLVIRKTDLGTPLYLVEPDHQPALAGENKKLISADMLNSLYAIWESENHIRFASEEGTFNEVLPVEQVMEHFGILIITCSSDEFTYTYDKHTQSNTFRVQLIF